MQRHACAGNHLLPFEKHIGHRFYGALRRRETGGKVSAEVRKRAATHAVLIFIGRQSFQAFDMRVLFPKRREQPRRIAQRFHAARGVVILRVTHHHARQGPRLLQVLAAFMHRLDAVRFRTVEFRHGGREFLAQDALHAAFNGLIMIQDISHDDICLTLR